MVDLSKQRVWLKNKIWLFLYIL